MDAELWLTAEGTPSAAAPPKIKTTVESPYRADMSFVYTVMHLSGPSPGKYLCHARLIDRATKKVTEVAVPLLVVDDLAVFEKGLIPTTVKAR